jgi:hypothetical protein
MSGLMMRRRKMMNEYDFDIELADGTTMKYRTWAVCKLAAYEDLTAYLEECGINPEEVRVLDVYVHIPEDEEEK